MLSRFFVPVALALLALCPPLARGQNNPAVRPISVEEISLLLRSGYTGDEMLKETAGRPLLVPIDAAAEHTLLDAGADARTVAALRDGRRVASATEAGELRQRQAAAEQQKLSAWEADQSRRAEAGRQAVQTKLATRREEQLREVATGLHSKLVVCADGRVGPYDDAALANKKMFLFYAAAGANKASHQITPPLVDFYKKFAPTHPEFEVVLLSADRSAADMEKFMQAEAMPWPALAWEQLAKQPDLAGLSQAGIPRLVLIDGSGQKLADNLENGKLVNPQHVFEVLLGQNGVKQAGR